MPSPLASTPYDAFLLMAAVTWLSVSFWVSRDAAARGSSMPHLLGAVAVLSGVVGLYYLLAYRPAHARTAPPTRGERAAGTVAAAAVTGMLAGATLAPPDPFTGALWWLAAFVLLLPASYLLVYRRGYRRLPVVGSA